MAYNMPSYHRKRTRLILDVTTNYPVKETELMHAMNRLLSETLRSTAASVPLQERIWASDPAIFIEALSVSCYTHVKAAIKAKQTKIKRRRRNMSEKELADSMCSGAGR